MSLEASAIALKRQSRVAELAPLTGLRSLRLGNVFRLTDLAPLTFLTESVSLTFSTCQALQDVSALSRGVSGLARLNPTCRC